MIYFWNLLSSVLTNCDIGYDFTIFKIMCLMSSDVLCNVSKIPVTLDCSKCSIYTKYTYLSLFTKHGKPNYAYPIMHLDWDQYTGTLTQLPTTQFVSLNS